MMHMSEHVAELAAELSGNFLRFSSFAMRSDVMPNDPERWTVVYTETRDSGITARANARTIARTLGPKMGEDCQVFGASHWACGHVDGYLIRVTRDDGSITPAFSAYAEHAIGLQDYPVASDDDHSQVESEDALQTWMNCYSDTDRAEHLRKYWRSYRGSFNCIADLIACVRGEFAPWGDCGFERLGLIY